ncbi:MAG TPA: acetamidase, partial [Chloroflexota bacterium]|nr:acetamidase [Chloroflexota bacterium]
MSQTHRFEPTQFHIAIGAWEPALRIASGDTVETWTVDSGGRDKELNQRSPGGNPQTGPFYVEGAEPGDVLAVRFDRITPNRPQAHTSAYVSYGVVDPGFVPRFPRDRG